jgi:serine/threonine-protein kinase
MEIDRELWPVLSRLLDEALELPADARDTWLESLPAIHAALKPTLRELLNHHSAAETRDFLGTMFKVAANDDPHASAPIPSLAQGTTVGPYVIEEEIGRGGMGAVWRARRGDGVIKRPVALKLPHAGPHGQDLIERFARERDILAALAHPHIARLYDAGIDAKGQPFLALEYVPGQPITRYCDERRLDVPQRLRMFQQVLRAVQYAHVHLVVHRDIKPSNVIVGTDRRAMLLDFGIAKLVEGDASGEDAAARTQFAAAMTPDYASPEQIRGESVTTASDVYSLGVLLFEILTGRRPYKLKRDSRGALEDAILQMESPRPSQSVRDEAAALARSTTIKALARTLRGDLETIVLKALKKDPADRYATVDAFLQDIERYLHGHPVLARPDSRWYRVRKLVARHKLSAVTSAVALILIIATAAIALVEARRAEEQRDRALALASRNEAVSEFLNQLITEAGGAGKPVAVSDMLARAEALVNAEYRDQPEHRAAVLAMLGIYYHTTGEDVRAEPLLRQALEAVRTSPDGDLRRKLMCDHAMSQAPLGKVPESLRTLQAVVADPDTSPLVSAQCLEYLAFMAQDANDAAAALKYGNLALQRLREVPHSRALEAMFLSSVGYAEHLSGRNDAADRLFAQSLAEFARAGRDRNADAISVRNNAAVVSDGAGNPRRSLQLYEQTLAIVAQNDPGAQPPPYLVGNHAHALETLGRFGEATKVYQQCVAQTDQAGNMNSRAFCLLGLESVAQQTGDLAAAERYLAQANEIIPKTMPPAHPASLALRVARARIDIARHQFRTARADLDFVLANGKSGSAMSFASLARAELNLAENDVAAAESDARRALSIVQAAQGGIPYSNRTGAAWLMLGKVLAQKGEASAARAAFRAAIQNLSNTVDADHPLLQEAQRLAAR